MALTLPRNKKIEDVLTIQSSTPKGISLGPSTPAPKGIAIDTRPTVQPVARAARPQGNFFTDTGRNLANFGRDLVANTQQGIGSVADTAIKGGAILGDVADTIRGISDQQKARNYQSYENLRNNLVKNQTDVTGSRFAGTSDDISARDVFTDPQKAARLAGESLNVGLAATSLINPTRQVAAGLGGRQALVQGAKFAARDAGIYGGLDAAASGATVYGQTGDINKAVQEGAKAGLLSGVTQGGLDFTGSASGAAIRKSRDAIRKADEALQNVAEDVASRQKLISDRERSKQVNLPEPVRIAERFTPAGAATAKQLPQVQLKGGRRSYATSRSSGTEALTPSVNPLTLGRENLPTVTPKSVRTAATDQELLRAKQIAERPVENVQAKQAPVLRQAGNELPNPEKVPLEVTNAGTARGEFQRAITDKDAAVINYLKRIEKQTGKKGLVEQFYYDTGLQRRSNSIANATVQNSADIQGAFQGLKGQAKKDFDKYAAARNELTYVERGLQTSRSPEELQAIVNQLAPEHEARFAALNNFYKDYAQKQYDAGLIDKQTLDSYLANNDYSRIQRDMADLANPRGKGGNSYSFGTPSARQKRIGSQREVQPADITAINYAQSIQSEIQRNQTASNLIDVLAEQGHARRVADTTRKNTISRVVNGKTEVYEIPRDIKEVVDNVTPYQLGVLSRIIAAPQRLLRAGATGLSVPFTAANYVKDQVSSAIFSKNFLATHTPQNVFSGLYNAAKDYGVGNNDALWQKFIAHSGDATSVDFIRNIKGGNQISREIRLGQAGRLANKTIHPIRTLEDLNQITERATRFQNFKGIYNDVLKKTGNEAEATRQATLAAWQNSTDFSRMGNVSQVLNLLIPYFNAGVQGTRLLGRRMVQSPVGTTAKLVSFIGMPLAAATFYNLQDPETKKVYDNISDYEKENNVIIVLPGATQQKDGSYTGVVKIPLQQGVSNLVQPMRHAVESYFNSNQADFPTMAAEFLGAVSGPINTSSPEKALGGLIPQAVKPLVQQAANQDFYSGKQIVPDYINQSTDAAGNPVAEKDKAFSYTSGSADMIGKALGISPIRVEKFIKDTSGKVGQYTENAVDTALNAAGLIKPDQVGGVSAGEDIYRRFAVASGKENFQKSEGAKYFDRVKEATSKLNTNEKAAFSALHPTKKNFLGDVITETDSVYDPAARLDAYNRYPKVFEADKKLDAQNRALGKPGNPLFDLAPDQVKKVLEKDNLPPGAKDPELSNLYTQPWYEDYQSKRSAYFDGIKAQQEQELAQAHQSGDTKKVEALTKAKNAFDNQTNPYPTTSPELQQVIDYYSSLPKGTGARKNWIAANPEAYQAMQNQYAAVDNWQNNRRVQRGLAQTEGEVGKANGYTAYTQSSDYSSYGKKKGVGAQDTRKYALSVNSKEVAKPTVTAKKGKTSSNPKAYKARVSTVSQPKVTLKKSKV